MSRPFNFFQFAESGSLFANPTTFSGFYTPSGMAINPTNFIFPISFDAEFAFPSTDIAISGNINDSNIENTLLTTVFSGSFYPVMSGECGLDSKITGQITKDYIDPPYLSLFFSGQHISGNFDPTYYVSQFSGNFNGGSLDSNILSCSLSGEIVNTPIDSSVYMVSFSGNIIKSDRDSVSLDGTIDTIYWLLGNARISPDFPTEQVVVGLDFDSICWSLFGCGS